MIDHVCIEVSSEERSQEIFEEILGLDRAYSFLIDEGFMTRMFGLENACEAVVYQAGKTKIEVFIRPKMGGSDSRTSHLCITVPDREKVLKACREKGVAILLHPRDGRPLYYIRDHDGNLYEIKELV